MNLLLNTQNLPLIQHPTRNQENRQRADDSRHPPRSRLVTRVKNAFAHDALGSCAAALWV
jgi:hypothetical protein